MKKFLSMILTVVTVFSIGCFTGCDNKSTGNVSNKSTPTADNGSSPDATVEGTPTPDSEIAEMKKAFKEANVGEYVTFGHYEQDSDTSNGKEEIEWLVLEKEDDKIFVISKYAFERRPYNMNGESTWENCSLRKWLNSTFINSAFSADEKAMILTAAVTADKNPEYGTNPGNATQDQVFLLSITEAEKYFSSNSARQCTPVDYAAAEEAFPSNLNKDKISCWWALRSPGSEQYYATGVSSDGSVDYFGVGSNNESYIRPAMWISTN